MRIHSSIVTWAAATAVAACGPSWEPETCADLTEAFAFPSPAWTANGSFGPPAGDRVAGLLLDRDHPWPQWYEQLALGGGWPRRPTLAIPLSATEATLYRADLALYGRPAGGDWRRLHPVIGARIENSTLVVKFDRALPPGIIEAIFAIGPDAIGGARALPVCDPTGEPYPDYARARTELATITAINFALPFSPAPAHQPLARLWERAHDDAVLEVAEVEARALESFGVPVSAGVTANARATAASGLLSLPDYRSATGPFELDDTGLPIVQGITEPGFIALLPQNGTPPFPLLIFQHGGENTKLDALLFYGRLAAAGFGLVAIDLIHHGDRAEGASGFLGFANFAEPIATREAFRQTSADHIAVVAGVETLNRELAPIFGLERAFDPQRIYYLGSSLGGITGSLTFSTVDEIQAAAMFVGGAGFAELGGHSIFLMMLHRIFERPPFERDLVLGLMEVMLNGADPFAYAQHAEDRSRPPRPVLIMQAVDDAIVASASTDALGRAFGADLATPFDHEVAGVAPASLPVTDNFTWPDGPGAGTRLIVQHPLTEVPFNDRHRQLFQLDYVQAMVCHCFAGHVRFGRCQVIDTGFGEH